MHPLTGMVAGRDLVLCPTTARGLASTAVLTVQVFAVYTDCYSHAKESLGEGALCYESYQSGLRPGWKWML
jgi:hypothetical protein